MNYIKETKAISISRKAWEQLKETNNILESIYNELSKIAESEDIYKDLADDAWRASACLDDFITSYQDFRGLYH
jgi:hypothetical protein